VAFLLHELLKNQGKTVSEGLKLSIFYTDRYWYLGQDTPVWWHLWLTI